MNLLALKAKQWSHMFSQACIMSTHARGPTFTPPQTKELRESHEEAQPSFWKGQVLFRRSPSTKNTTLWPPAFGQTVFFPVNLCLTNFLYTVFLFHLNKVWRDGTFI